MPVFKPMIAQCAVSGGEARRAAFGRHARHQSERVITRNRARSRLRPQKHDFSRNLEAA